MNASFVLHLQAYTISALKFHVCIESHAEIHAANMLRQPASVLRGPKGFSLAMCKVCRRELYSLVLLASRAQPACVGIIYIGPSRPDAAIEQLVQNEQTVSFQLKVIIELSISKMRISVVYSIGTIKEGQLGFHRDRNIEAT